MKKQISKAMLLFLFTVVFIFISFVPKKGLEPIHSEPQFQEEEPSTPEVVIDDTIYPKIEMRSFYIRNSLSTEDAKVSWDYQDSDKTYYLFLPKFLNRESIELEFDCGVPTYLSIYNEKNEFIKNIVSGEEVSLPEENYIFKFETNVEKVVEYKIKIIQSTISSVYVSIDGGNASLEKILGDKNHDIGFPGTATLIDTNNEITTAEIKKIKGRGNATWQREKKPFQMKFTEKKEIFNIPEAKNWLLLTNYPDGTLSRNSMWLTLAKELDMPYPVQYEPVDLYINHKYYGSYLLTSKVEENKNRVDLNTGDYLFEFDQYDDDNQIKLNHGYVANIHYPDLNDFTSDEKKTILNDAKSYLNKIESLIYNPKTATEELKEFIDLESFAKYYWVQELSANRDAARNSFYLFRKNGKLYAGPLWDMDATLSRSYVFTKNTGYYILDDETQNSRMNSNWFRPLLKRKDFSDIVDKTFIKYYNVFESCLTFLDNYQELIRPSATMNYIRWPYKRMMERQGQPWRAGDHDFESSYQLLKADFKTRLLWYKNEYAPVTYETYTYKAIQNDEEITTSTISSEQTILIPEETEKIVIYGIKNEKETKLKEFTFKDTCIKETIELETKTSSKYKTYNRNFLNISFCKSN